MTPPDPAVGWSIIVPVKDFSTAKSRVALPPAVRSELARAMARDTVAALIGVHAVRRVVLVGQRTIDLLGLAGGLRVDGLVQADDGLNEAVSLGARHLSAESPDRPVAVVPADLAAAGSADFADALRRCGGQHRAVVADHTGRGTVLLTAATPGELAPRFGTDSFARHVATGAHPVRVGRAGGLVWDIDTVADLHRAVGRHTRRLLAGLVGLPDTAATPAGESPGRELALTLARQS